MQMSRRSLLTILLVAIGAPLMAAQNPPQKIKSVRLYVFDCGKLKSGNPAPLLERGVTTTDMSVEAFLVVHPRGVAPPAREPGPKQKRTGEPPPGKGSLPVPARGSKRTR